MAVRSYGTRSGAPFLGSADDQPHDHRQYGSWKAEFPGLSYHGLLA
ncbi:hypothetical protein [Siphonobacter sp. SORGH_AS_0500]|nr:hypothetical protein [Siphonobacter sp. SORGH_AS_0500]